jgi:hypothetical protein
MFIKTTLNRFWTYTSEKGEQTMNNRILFPLVVLCVVMALMVSSLYAQEERSANRRIGSAAATELLIPIGARDMAMAGASLAITHGVESIFWNPAGLARMASSSEAMVSTMSYIADISVNWGAVGVKFGSFGVIGVSAKMLSFGDIPLTTNEDPEALMGRTYSPNFMTLGMTYARRFTDAITVGATFKIVSEKIARVSGQAFAIDLGVQYHSVAGISGLNFGIILKNYGPQMNFDGTGLLQRCVALNGRRPEQYFQLKPASYELPSTLDIGMSYVRDFTENIVFSGNVAFINDNMALNAYRFGGEVGYKMDALRVFGRGGYEYVPGEDIDEDIFGACFGFGLYYKLPSIDIMLDYSFRQTEYFDNSNVFSFKFGF